MLFVLASCSREQGSPAQRTDAAAGPSERAAAPPLAAGVGLVPLFGGVVRQVGQYVVELLARDDGSIQAQVRDPQGQPVPPEAIEVTAAIDNAGTEVEVPMVPTEGRYVGVVAGVQGPHDVTVNVAPEGTPEVQVAFPAVEVTSVEARVEPLHSGQVTFVGDNRVEVAAQNDGEVYVSVTDYQGVPLPPTAVQLHHVTVVTPTGPQVVVLEPRGAIFVGTLGVPPPPTFAVSFDLRVHDMWYRRVRLRHFRPLPPTAVVTVPAVFPAPGVWLPVWGPPPPVWGPAPVKVHPGKGWAKGWGPHPIKVQAGHGPAKAWSPAPAKGGGHGVVVGTPPRRGGHGGGDPGRGGGHGGGRGQGGGGGGHGGGRGRGGRR
jgi:uncharacterized membrane protein YgcG